MKIKIYHLDLEFDKISPRHVKGNTENTRGF